LVRRASVRYSRFVGMMKFLLPAFAVVLIGLVVAWPQLDPGGGGFRVGYSAIGPADIENPRMVAARYTGIDAADRPFAVTADTATQIAADSPLVDLDNPQADVTLANGSWVALSALTGTYNQKTHDLELRQQVNLFHDAGYEFHTPSAHIDLKEASAHGDAPVEGQGPFGHITADGFRVLDRGKTVIFTGQARMVIHPGATGALPESGP
jgi:lipopolysaccharide export system protein LptC